MDNEGNTMKVKKKTKLCEHIQQKKLCADETVSIKGKDSFYRSKTCNVSPKLLDLPFLTKVIDSMQVF